MPTLDQHQSGQFTKLLLIGESGTGKTGGLASLAMAGYKLRILDMDNGLDSLAKQLQYVISKGNAKADVLKNVEFRSLRDKVKATPTGPVLDGQPKAFIEAMKMLDHWRYEGTDLGKPADFGPEAIVVIDSLTFLSNAAYDFCDAMNPSVKDKRQIYYSAQESVEQVLALLSSESFRTNVIVISHIRWVERQDGTTKGYPSAVGGALSPKIPAYFNSLALAQSVGSGSNVKRTIQTAPTPMIDLKNPAPFAMLPSLPLETGLADFFKTVRA